MKELTCEGKHSLNPALHHGLWVIDNGKSLLTMDLGWNGLGTSKAQTRDIFNRELLPLPIWRRRTACGAQALFTAASQ